MERRNRLQFGNWDRGLLLLLCLIVVPLSIDAQSSKLDGMWSDTPNTAVGLFCFAWCTDVGIDRLNKLLDDPANDSRPYEEIAAEAGAYQRKNYIEPKLIGDAKKKYPLDPLEDDPSYLHCVPWGVGQQMFAPHQLEIRQRDKSRVNMRYGEWDARRTIYLNVHSSPTNQRPTLLGYSVGHWEGDSLVVETSGISPNVAFFIVPHSDQLRIVERYTRSDDGKTLLLNVTLEDPLSWTGPVVLKKFWSWSPNSRITPYKDCKRPEELKRGASQ